jgi:hypothetical protein
MLESILPALEWEVCLGLAKITVTEHFVRQVLAHEKLLTSEDLSHFLSLLMLSHLKTYLHRREDSLTFSILAHCVNTQILTVKAGLKKQKMRYS